jgi:hypothetical protein
MENTELVTIDLKNPTKGIIEFQEVHEQLDDLVEKYDVILDASTEDGYLQTKDAIKVLSGVRIKVEKARKAWKAPVLEAGKAIDKFAKSLETVVVGLEKPMISAKQEQDNKVKLAKEKRLNDLNIKIKAITDASFEAIGKPAIEIQAIIERVEAVDALEGFYDLTDKAIEARLSTLEILKRAHAQQNQQEAQAEENARLRAMLESKPKLEVQSQPQDIAPIQPSAQSYQPAPVAVAPVQQQAPIAKKVDLDQVAKSLVEFFEDNEIDNLETIAEMIVNNQVPFINVTVKD